MEMTSSTKSIHQWEHRKNKGSGKNAGGEGKGERGKGKGDGRRAGGMSQNRYAKTMVREYLWSPPACAVLESAGLVTIVIFDEGERSRWQ